MAKTDMKNDPSIDVSDIIPDSDHTTGGGVGIPGGMPAGEDGLFGAIGSQLEEQGASPGAADRLKTRAFGENNTGLGSMGAASEARVYTPEQIADYESKLKIPVSTRPGAKLNTLDQ